VCTVVKRQRRGSHRLQTTAALSGPTMSILNTVPAGEVDIHLVSSSPGV
jgi:hypothetical protein